ncbi:hypothetical protein GALL_545020 [mine drainage metagenome]|uniref:Uncharacterized protein n=1 Tax=mine drainage metagenome TaxID=410659 RepID=A0A1J5NYS2_9ZZZZ
MRDDEGSGAVMQLHLLQLAADEQGHFVIEGGKRLVEEQDFRAGRQGAHDGNELLLAAGEFIGVATQVEAHVEGVDQIVDPRLHLRLLHASAQQRVFDVAPRREPGQKRFAVVLEYVSDDRIAQALAVEQDLPTVHRKKPCNHVDQGGFAAAVGTEHRDDLAARNVQVQAVVERNAAEALVQPADGDMGVGGRRQAYEAGLFRTRRGVVPPLTKQSGYGVHLPSFIFHPNARSAARSERTAD